MKQNADKINALSETELSKQLKDGVEQMFRLRFQLSMGQADGLKKLRQLRKERARLLTVERQRQISAKATAATTTTTAVTPVASKVAAKKITVPKAAAPKVRKPKAVAEVTETAAPKAKKAETKKPAAKKTASKATKE